MNKYAAEGWARAEARRCRWLFAWVVLFLVSGLLLVLDADWMAATFDGRHLLLVASVIGVASCAERQR